MQRVVGKGAFGKVRIVQKKDQYKQLFALKYIDKMQCIRMHAIQNIFRERAILQDLSHPFIVNLNYAFQDDQNLFFVLDLKTGGDLRHHLSNTLGFSEDAVRLWAVELGLAVQYLHDNNIVHRDIKPDNVLLDELGHAHLTDFNIAVNIDRNSILKSRSGTMAYLAPEVFGDNGYYWQVDWWSLGVMLYELIYFKARSLLFVRPFRGKTTTAMISSIRDSDILFPKTNVFSKSLPVEISAHCVSFLAELMDRNPITRLGCRQRQILDLKGHAWLSGFDWRAVERKEAVSKFIPDSEDDNFDPRINLEEFLLDGFPIEAARRQKKKKKSSGKRTKATTSSSPNAGSFLAYFSGNTSSNRKKSAADAAAVAGNMQAMMKQYKSQHNPVVSAGFSMFKKKGQQQQQQQKMGQQLTESERIELELRFMNDHFLPYDSTKRAPPLTGVGSGVAPPVPPIPSPAVLKQLGSANNINIPPINKNNGTGFRNPDAIIPMAGEPGPSSYQLNNSGFPRNETPMDQFLRSNTSIDYCVNSDMLQSSFANSSIESNLHSSAPPASPKQQTPKTVRSVSSLNSFFKRKAVVSKTPTITKVQQPNSVTTNKENAYIPTSFTTSSDETSSSNYTDNGNFTFRDSTTSPLAKQAKYDANSIKRIDSPMTRKGSPAVSVTGSGVTPRKTFRVTTVPLPDTDLMESHREGGMIGVEE
ncbi:UNVERIFIED_CONTAM: hypothetical protein HDU68_008481 [Siphonaria sp. JEL0065]|nr:hypothetical protein HDU68_008481 [Siphonaria sp. JEL0065]